MLVDTRVDVDATYRIRIIADANPSQDGITVEPRADAFLINTGPASFRIDPGSSEIVQELAPLSRRVSVSALDARECELNITFDEWYLEATGHCRTTVRLDGRMHDGDYACVRVRARVDFFAGSPVVRVSVGVRNTRRALHKGGMWELGDPGSVYFRDISLVVQTPASIESVQCWSELHGEPRSLHSPFLLYQDSSGGENWRSTVHVNRGGRVPLRFRGYRLESADGAWSGLRAEPVVTASHDSGGCTSVCIQQFWQNFPKAIEADRDRMTLRLFPRQFDDLHELQGGEQKTHIAAVAFGPDAISDVPLDWIRTPLLLSVTPEWYAAAEAVPYLTPASEDTNKDYLQLVSAAIEGDDTFEKKRERIDEYGWRNFGDIYADHEAVFHKGPAPLVSHYNNQYDAVAGFAIQFMRSGDVRWWQAMSELAAHVTDIDLYHTRRDRAAYNGGCFWHTFHYKDAGRSTHRAYPRAEGVNGGGPSNEQDYSTGLMFHHFLTGSAESRESVRQLSEWVVALDDGTRSPFRWLSRANTGLASATASPLYHGPGRGAANSISTLLNAHRLTAESRFQQMAEALIHRCVHPGDNVDGLNLLDAERRWSYTVFLQALGRYLDDKAQRSEMDNCYAYARASLVHYAEWMATHEYPYLDRPEILEYPTETWSAQDMRKSEIFKFAARYVEPAERERFLERSTFFFRSSVDALRRSPTRTFARPVVLLLSYGYMESAYQHGVAVAAPAIRVDQFGEPSGFRPQRQIAVRRAKLLVIATLSVAVALLLYIMLAHFAPLF